MLGVVMTDNGRTNGEHLSILDVVALLVERPVDRLARGQVGTVVELLDDRTVLVEFNDDKGRAYAVTACAHSELLVLHDVPQAV